MALLHPLAISLPSLARARQGTQSLHPTFRARYQSTHSTRVLSCRASSKDDSDIGETTYAVAGAVGLAAESEVFQSLSFLSKNGCGLPAGAGGIAGLIEGLSYLGVIGVLGASAASYVKTGKGLPTGREG